MTLPISSPCIGICSTVYGDNICRGCKRNYIEVIQWNSYAPEQKQKIYQRLQRQIEIVVADFLIVENPLLLKSQLDQITNRPLLYPDSTLYCAYELLRLKAVELISLQPYGIQIIPPYHTLTPNALFTLLDEKLYSLAQGS